MSILIGFVVVQVDYSIEQYRLAASVCGFAMQLKLTLATPNPMPLPALNILNIVHYLLQPLYRCS